MTPQKSPFSLALVLGVLLFGAASAGADESCDFDDVAIFGTSSVDIGANVTIFSGDVIVNESGGLLSLGNKAKTPGPPGTDGFAIKADTIELGTNVTIGGDSYCNQPSDLVCDFPFVPPVLTELPQFKAQEPKNDPPDDVAPDVNVGGGATVMIGAGEYGDINVAANGTVVFEDEGVYVVRSIVLESKATLEVTGAVEILVWETISASLEADINPLGPAASSVLFFVNGDDSGGGPAVQLGSKSDVNASFYAPNGTIVVAANVIASGAFWAKDVVVGQKAQITLDSGFVNQAPTAEPKTVFTDGADSIVITLEGSDAEFSGLSFDITVDPDSGIGSLSEPIDIQDPGQCSAGLTPMGGCLNDGECDAGETCVLPPIVAANVTYTPVDPEANLTNSFQYTVTDDCGLVSEPATVDINPPGDPTDPPDDPIALVDASDVSAETTTNTSRTIKLKASAPGFCSVSGTVCSDIEDGDPLTTNSTDCPLNQDGDPETSETCDADPLDFFIESLPSLNGTLSDPSLGSITSVPFDLSGSTVTYTPPFDFTSGTCSISGAFCEVDDDCLPDGGTCSQADQFDFSVSGVQGGLDSATVFVDVFAAEELAQDLSVETGLNTPVQITLQANLGGTGTGGAAPSAPAAAATPPYGAGSASSSGASGPEAQALGPMPAQPASYRIDFGVTPDDFGNANPCGFTTITTQYVDTQSIVFGTAVDFPLAVTIPNVVIVNDSAASPPCRSSGEPVFTGDWWAQFRQATGPGAAGGPAGVNSFSVDVGFINNPGDAIADLIAYDIDGNVIDEAFTTATGGSFQVLTVSDPEGDKQIAFVHVNSSDDLAGLGMDFLDYDEPAAIGTPLEIVYTITGLPTTGALTFNGVAVFVGQTFTEAPTLVYTSGTSGTDTFTYSVTEAGITDTALVSVLVGLNDECILVGREPGCSPGGGGAAPEAQVAQEELQREVEAGPSRGLTVVIEGEGGSVSSSPVELSAGRVLLGIGCSAGECNKVLPEGAEIQLFARPDGEHFEFVRWGGDCSGTSQIITVRLAETTACTALFQKRNSD